MQSLQADLSANRPTIYMVDADAGFRSRIGATMTEWGYSVRDYSCATHLSPVLEAERNAGSLRDACLLLDFDPPEFSRSNVGERFSIQGLWPADPMDGMKVICMSSCSNISLAATLAMNNGAAGFLHKPFEEEVLRTVVGVAFATITPSSEADASRAATARAMVDTRSASTTASPGHIEYHHRINQLTPREDKVFVLMSKRLSAKMIARELGITYRTAEHYRSHVLKKLGAASTADLIAMVERQTVDLD